MRSEIQQAISVIKECIEMNKAVLKYGRNKLSVSFQRSLEHQIIKLEKSLEILLSSNEV